MESKTVDFIKQKDDLYNDLRDDFDSSIRSNFIKMLYNDASCLPNLKASGISDAAIAAMKTGAVPATHEVHHKIPLRQGGTNDKENLVLIKKDPWHKVITNLQNSLQVGMKIGEKRTITNWPWPKGNIYPT